MDTINIIIITAVLNAIITGGIGGLVIYRIQKKIDNAYFQRQTVFVKNYDKMIETLETIYKKCNILKSALRVASFKNQEILLYKGTINYDDVDDVLDSLSDASRDIDDYFNSHKLYLSDESSLFVGKKLMAIQTFTLLAKHHFIFMPEPNLSFYINTTNKFLELFHAKTKLIVPDNYNAEETINNLNLEIGYFITDIENHYKKMSKIE